MRDLLDASSRRVIRILETLIDREGWITVAGLAKAVGGGERTVAKDLAVLRKRWGQSLGIDTSTKNGVKLRNRNIAAISKVFIDLFNESTALRWISEIVFTPRQSIEFYEKRLFTSRSTLIRLLPRINRFFAQRDMAIRCEGNRYELVGGDEQYLRQFCTGFLLELHGLDLRDYHVAIDLSVLERAVHAITASILSNDEYAFLSQDDISTVYYMMFYLMSLVRENQGYTVASSRPTSGEISPEDVTSITAQFPHVTEKNLRPIHEFIASQHGGWDSDEEKTLVFREADAFYDRMVAAIGASETGIRWKVRFIVWSAYLVAKTRPYRTSELFDRIHYFTRSFQKSSPSLYRLILDNLEVFSRNVHFDTSSQSDTVVFWLCLSCPDIALATPRKKALVVSDFGMQHANFLATSIAALFDRGTINPVNITALGYADALQSLASEHYDIVITTMPELQSAYADAILINDFPDYDDFFQLYRALRIER